MCKEIFKTTPDDPRITEMDPVTKGWMFQNWLEDKNELYELSKHNAYISGSFVNPEAVSKLIDDSSTISSDEEEFEEATQMVLSGNIPELGILKKEENTNQRKRKRKLKLKNK